MKLHPQFGKKLRSHESREIYQFTDSHVAASAQIKESNINKVTRHYCSELTMHIIIAHSKALEKKVRTGERERERERERK